MTLKEIARRKKELNQLIKTLDKSVKSIDKVLQREDYILDLEYDVEQILIKSYASIEYVYKDGHSFIPSAQSRIDHRIDKNIIEEICDNLTYGNSSYNKLLRSCKIKIDLAEEIDGTPFYLCEITGFEDQNKKRFCVVSQTTSSYQNLLKKSEYSFSSVGSPNKIYNDYDEAKSFIEHVKNYYIKKYS